MSNRDFPMVQGVVLMSGVMIVILNFVIDNLYAYVDPRIRLAR
jgi:ABC-type dipeptide/oligopeptide/nickel transport system permease component